MNMFKKLFIFLFPLLFVIIVLRISNGGIGFISTTELLLFFKKINIEFDLSSFNELISTIQNYVDGFPSLSINNANDLLNLLKYLVNFIPTFFYSVFLVFRSFLQFNIDILSGIGSFFNALWELFIP